MVEGVFVGERGGCLWWSRVPFCGFLPAVGRMLEFSVCWFVLLLLMFELILCGLEYMVLLQPFVFAFFEVALLISCYSFVHLTWVVGLSCSWEPEPCPFLSFTVYILI